MPWRMSRRNGSWSSGSFESGLIPQWPKTLNQTRPLPYSRVPRTGQPCPSSVARRAPGRRQAGALRADRDLELFAALQGLLELVGLPPVRVMVALPAGEEEDLRPLGHLVLGGSERGH